MECHDCRTGLESDTAYFSPAQLDKYIRCFSCWKAEMTRKKIPYQEKAVS